jgi:hypothetical protein
MSNYVPVPVQPNLLSIVNLLTTLADTEPVVADHIAPILVTMLDFAMTSGKVTDPKVWVRALQGAVAFIETKHIDDEWLSMLPVNKDEGGIE